MPRPEVAITNCGTSILAGCVVFPVLGFLAQELHEPLNCNYHSSPSRSHKPWWHLGARTDPCVSADSLDSLKSIGLSGSGQAVDYSGFTR